MGSKKHFYLVSGSNLEKIKEQAPDYILDFSAGIFPCGGNQFYIKEKQVYNRKFDPHKIY